MNLLVFGLVFLLAFFGGAYFGYAVTAILFDPKPEACKRCPENPDNYS